MTHSKTLVSNLRQNNVVDRLQHPETALILDNIALKIEFFDLNSYEYSDDQYETDKTDFLQYLILPKLNKSR